ncbi:hypothetical protein [Nostoc sp. ChiQUE01b]|uniref:hypothetical protein n=1 Tax=Nostoc sp. ChiQUE01b TaxID=3075376 RepID=UPI002AD4A567|nr:hypothetical protein [Nostoc sp. ChiQUE01b]MDZ8262965.1 hypothetical protein [Nostoc sp. ChiQUE01b]
MENQKLEQEALEKEREEKRRIMIEIAQEEERKWYEEHGDEDYEYDEEEDE